MRFLVLIFLSYSCVTKKDLQEALDSSNSFKAFKAAETQRIQLAVNLITTAKNRIMKNKVNEGLNCIDSSLKVLGVYHTETYPTQRQVNTITERGLEISKLSDNYKRDLEVKSQWNAKVLNYGLLFIVLLFLVILFYIFSKYFLPSLNRSKNGNNS